MILLFTECLIPLQLKIGSRKRLNTLDLQPKVITHDKRLKNVSKELEYFHNAMLPLKDRTLALLIQLPPSLKISEGIENMRQYLVPELDSSNFRYAVEVRDRSWFQDSI